MAFEFSEVTLIFIAYMAILFGVAFATDKAWIPDSIVRHPITYVLSLGVFASAFAFYGIVDLAYHHGYGALAYYLGAGALFIFAPVALKPLIGIVHRYQIASLADLLVFRYHSQLVGSVATLCLILAVVPILGLQLQAIADTLSLLTVNNDNHWSVASRSFSTREVLALIYCLLLTAFTVLFGSRRERRWGLVFALGLESLIKTVALLTVGLFAVYAVFGGFGGLDQWLLSNPENMERLHSPISDTASSALLLIFIGSTLAMPHIFHMCMVENPIHQSLGMLSWAIPLLLLFMALPIFPILWAGFALDVSAPIQYFPLAVPMAMGADSLSILVFLGGLSAATGAQITIALASATMMLNHWLLPAFRIDAQRNVYQHIDWLRRGLILAVFLAGFLFFLLVHNRYSLGDLAILAFIEALQFLPGIVAIAFWPRANARGLLCGLLMGSGVWIMGLFLPMVLGIEAWTLPGLSIAVGIEHWDHITLWSITLNLLLFTAFSWFHQASPEERYSAELCSVDEIAHPVRSTLDAHSPTDFINRLAEGLGPAIATQEVNRALGELGLGRNERRPYALRRLRSRLAANLSGIFGVAMAGEILDRYLPYKRPQGDGAADIHLIEERFARDENSFSGLAAQLNHLRLYYRKTLQELPMAICSLGPDEEILMWNHAMARLTRIDSADVTGSHLCNLDEPWRTLIKDFSQDQAPSHRQAILIDGETRWLSLHKATIQGPVQHSADGQVILLEDVTEVQLLERELLHSERLASVGRLAAGMAHEIGNPITGIACLAQNLHYETNDPKLLDTADQILLQTKRVDRIVKSLMAFSHGGIHDSPEREIIHLRPCVDEAIHLLSLQQDKTAVDFRNEVPDEVCVEGDQQQLIQVFLNLLANARDASTPGGPVTVAASVDQEKVVVTVTDQGSGIDARSMEKIMEPFYTTKDPGQGTGLGLPMVYSIVTEHHGQIEISSPVNGQPGTRFTLKFPFPAPQ